MALEKGMIKPFEDRQVRKGGISFGVSSYGYDIRIADEFKIFTNINNTIVDPKAFDPRSFVDFQGEVALIPPNSFALGRSVEYFKIPRNVLTICVGKSNTPLAAAHLLVRLVAARTRSSRCRPTRSRPSTTRPAQATRSRAASWATWTHRALMPPRTRRCCAARWSTERRWRRSTSKSSERSGCVA